MGDIRLFVSHSHKDKEIAAGLVDVIEATTVPRERILCTSHDNKKYREPNDVDDERLLIEIRISNATLKVKKGEDQTVRYIHAKETEKQPGGRFHLPRHPSTRPEYPDGRWPMFA